jgi:mRNA interferase MazF
LPTFDDPRLGPGDVVVVPFPFSDRLAEKRRPALVVSGRELVDAGVVWLLMITSAQRGVEDHDLVIDDLSAAGLTRPCVVRPTKIACIEPSRILRRAGRLSPALSKSVLRRARSFIPAHPSDKREIE